MGPSSTSETEIPLPSSDETFVEGDGVRSRPEVARGRGDQVGRYLLLDPLGRGAMGQVFRAYDPDLDRQVAIKILHEPAALGPDARVRLLGEAKAMARIHHPHVVTVHDAGMHEGSVFIAMEIVDGPSLDRWLAAPRSPAEILDVLTDAARGLAAAHAAGVVHRDFKPANVLVGPDGRAKVGDFGLAGIEDPAPPSGDDGPTTHDSTTRGRPTRAMGTPAYMSPEHFAGVGIDARSDQYSFAIALHEALYGTRPFSAESLPELVAQVTSGELPAALAARRGRIDAIIRRALGADPTQRYPSMDQLIAALERARRPTWRRWAVAGSVVVAAGLLIFAGTRDDAETEQCVPGTQRVEAIWNEPAKAALHIGGSDYTDKLIGSARERFVTALDHYAAAWSVAHDESCAAVGPRADRGTAEQRYAAQCLENRLDSLEGLAELATHGPVDAGSVGDLAGTLPALDDCASNKWVPYPADPEAAARAAELYRRLYHVRRVRLADYGDDVVEDARVLVDQARELGEGYILALALRENARLREDVPESDALLDEALRLALEGGHDQLAVELVNDVLLAAKHTGHASVPELQHLVAAARGLAVRSGISPTMLGNLALNEGSLLRYAGRIEEAATRDREAEAYYASVGNHNGVARARTNQLVSMVKLGKLESVIEELPRTVQVLQARAGETSPTASQAQMVLVGSLAYAGRMRESFAAAEVAFEQAQEHFTPRSFTFQTATEAYLMGALNVGNSTVIEQTLAELRSTGELAEPFALRLDIIELMLLELQGRHEELLRRIPTLEPLMAGRPAAEASMDLDVLAARSLFLLGRHAEAQQVLMRPSVQQRFTQRELEGDLDVDLVVLAAIMGTPPPPPGHTWSELVTSIRAPTHTDRLLTEAISAVETMPDATATVRRTRDELAASCNDRDADVRVLDAWLANSERPPP